MKDPKGPTRSYKTVQEIAKKHKVPAEHIQKQLEMGTKVEFEHTTSRKNAEITALQHLDEFPDYYTRLKKMETKKSPVKESVDNNRQLLAGKRYCLLCNKHETESQCSWGPVMWKKYSIASIHPANESYVAEDHKEIASGKKKDEEGYMARIEFDQIERSINILRKLVKSPKQQLPAWVQSKITRAADFIDTAAEYMSSDEDVSEGMDMKDFKANRQKNKRRAASADAVKRGHVGKEWYNSGRRYSPDEAKRMRSKLDDAERRTRHRSAVDPDDEDDNNYSADKTKNPKKIRKQKAMGELGEGKTFNKFMTEVAAWQRKEGKNPTGGLNAVGRASAKKQGMNLKPPVTKPPSELDPDSEAAKRRNSFCARMGGSKGPMRDEKGRPTRKALALRKWNC